MPPPVIVYLGGLVDDELKSELEAHIANCRVCASELDLLKRIKITLESTPEDTSPVQDSQIIPMVRVLPAYAAADESALQERIGAEFKARNPIHFQLNYVGNLHFLDQHTALFVIRDANKPTAELDGKEIMFHVKTKADEDTHVSATIRHGEVVIDFTKLGLSIEDYAQVNFRLHIDESTIDIEGTLGHE